MKRRFLTQLRGVVRLTIAFVLLACIWVMPIAAMSTADVVPMPWDTVAGDLPSIPQLPGTNAISSPETAFSNTGAITLTDVPSGPGAQAASPYPSNITVSGLTGTLATVTVTFNNLSMPRPRDNDFALVGPTGQAFLLMSDTGDLTAASGLTITLSDAAATALPTGSGSSLSSGTFKPTDFFFAPGDDTFPSPGPATFADPAPTGTATLTTAYGGSNPNGTWSLYAEDDSLGGGAGSMAGGWTITITTNVAAAATTTTVSSAVNPSLTTQAVLFTATVTSSAVPVTTGTVTFTDGATTLASGVALNGSGQATYNAPANTLTEGTHAIKATYNGTASFATSNGTVTQTVDSPTVQTGAQFCNNGGFNIADGGTSTPYPSRISVSGLQGTVSKVTVNLKGITAPRPTDLDELMVGPSSQTLMIMSDVSDLTPASGINLTLDDAASSGLPTSGGLSSGTFKPTDVFVLGAGDDTLPSPAPASFNEPAPTGSATLASAFNGTNPNGFWDLYVRDDGIGGGGSSMTGWCVNFTITPIVTTTTVASSVNPSAVGQSVTFTATVTSGSGIPTGNVQFVVDGSNSGGPVALNGSGAATLITSALTAGTHTITANYLGTTGTGGGGFATSSGSLPGGQVVDGTPPSITNVAQVPAQTVPAPAVFTVNVTDNVAVGSVSVVYAVNGGGPTTAACSFVSGSQYSCTIPTQANPSSVAYQVRATDTVGNIATAPTAPNLFTVGAPTIPTGTYNALSLGGGTFGGNVSATTNVTLSGIVNASTFTLSLGCGTAVTGAGAASYVIGNINQTFCAPGSFTFPTGTTPNGPGPPPGKPDAPQVVGEYSPLTVNVTSVTSGSTLTVSTTDDFLPGIVRPGACSRYWSLTKTGTMTADLTFNYLPADDDLDNQAANWKTFKDESGVTSLVPGSVVNTGASTVTVTGISSFSLWGLGQTLAPTAAAVSVSGRILTANGQGIRNALVTVSGGDLSEPITVQTGSFGYYTVDGLTAGQTYVIQASAKRYTFSLGSQIINVTDNLTEVDFTANP